MGSAFFKQKVKSKLGKKVFYLVTREKAMSVELRRSFIQKFLDINGKKILEMGA